MPSLVRRNSEAELQAFDLACSTLAGFTHDISFEWVDGFLAALAAGPRVPEMDDWLPLMCGDAFERAFADPTSADEARRALQLRLKVLCEQLDPAALMDNPQQLRLDPLISEWTDADRQRMIDEEGVNTDEADQLQTGAVWSEGFLDAMEVLPEIWIEPSSEEESEMFGAMVDQVAALMMPPSHEAYAAHVAQYYPQGAPTRDELLAEACWSVQDLRMYWVDHAPKPATRRVQAQPGRNDPCPCGSGKKFKKCHGAAAGAA